MNRQFCLTHTVRYDECNCDGFLTPAAFLRYMQDIAAQDAEDVRLHRVRGGDRRDPQRDRIAARGVGAAAHMTSLAGRLFTKTAIARLAVIALMLAIWEIAARGLVDPLFLAPPTRVLWSIDRVFATNGVPAAVGITLVELVVAFALSVAIGLAVGLVLGLFDFPRRSFMPMVLLVYGMPQITILPLFVLYFGIGPASKIAFGVTHGMFPIIVTVVAGVQNIKPILLVSARAMGANFWQLFRYVIFPHMIPVFFTGMRPSEALGLGWGDVDLRRGEISISKSRYLVSVAKLATDREI